MFYQFVQKAAQNSDRLKLGIDNIKVLVFEKQDTFGPGFPHSDKYVLSYHLTNMCAHDMSIRADNPMDFQQWADANCDRIKDHHHGSDNYLCRPAADHRKCRHYPRALMGEYLKARFREALGIARKLGLKVELFPGYEVTEIKEDRSAVSIRARLLKPEADLFRTADRVLLATGHWFEAPAHRQYFPSPWPARKLLQSIPAGEHVGVIGTSLSAIETVLTLTSDGRFKRAENGELIYLPGAKPRKIALYSRRGMLPKVRGRMGTYQNKFLTREKLNRHRQKNNGRLPLEMIFQLLNSDLESAYGRPFDWKKIIRPAGSQADLLQKSLEEARSGDGTRGDLIWQTVLHQTFPMARDIYLSLSLEDRKRFDRQYTTLFFIHAATQPVINAEKILALLKSGNVSIHRLGKTYRFFRDESVDRFIFSYCDQTGNRKKDSYRYVVNARGQEKSLATDPSELAQNLLKSRSSWQIPSPGTILPKP